MVVAEAWVMGDGGAEVDVDDFDVAQLHYRDNWTSDLNLSIFFLEKGGLRVGE